MNQPLGSRVAANAASAFASQLTLSGLGLVATAVLVRQLGAAAFGAWSLIVSLIAYFGMLDLGLGVSLVRRVATARGSDSRDEVMRAAGAAVGALTLLAIAAGSLLMLVAVPLAGWLDITGAETEAFIAAVRIGAVGAALSLPGVALGAIPTAYQRLDSVVRLEAAAVVVTMMLQIALVLAGGGLVALAAAFTAGRLFSLAMRLRLVHRTIGMLPWRLDPAYPFWKELGRFGAWKVVHQISSQLVLYFDRLLVGLMVSVEAVAYYTIAVELAQRLLVVQANVGLAYYPAACAAAHDRDSTQRLYLRTSRAVSLLTLPLAVSLALLAEPVLRVWVGSSFVEPGAALLRTAAVAYGAMALTSIPAAAADALGHPGIAARYGMAGVLLNVTLALLLIPRFGASGAVWALAGNVLLQSPWFVRRVTAGLIGMPLWSYVRAVLVAPLVPTAAAGAAIGLVLIAAGPGAGAGAIAGAAAAGAMVFAATGRVTRVVAPEEREFVATLPGGRLLRWVVGS